MFYVLSTFLIFLLNLSFLPSVAIAADLSKCELSVEVDLATFNTIATSNWTGRVTDTARIEITVDNKITASVLAKDNPLSFNLGGLAPGQHDFFIAYRDGPVYTTLCGGSHFIVPDVGQVGQSGGTITSIKGNITFSPQNPTSNDVITIDVKDLPEIGVYFVSVTQGSNLKNTYRCPSSDMNKHLALTIGPLERGTWNVSVMKSRYNQNLTSDRCMSDLPVLAASQIFIPLPPTPTPNPIAPSPPCSEWIAELSGTPIPIPPEPTGAAAIWQDSKIIKKCASVSTGLGINVSTDAGALVKSVFGVILSISGGIALILIMVSGYRLIFSQGNPEEVKGAQEQLTSAVVGLLFIVFSLVILQIIGANILQIPGFTP